MMLPKKLNSSSLLILASLVILFGIYLAFSRKPSRAPEAETQSSWSTYTNEFINASFDYPSGWYLNEDVSRVNLVISDYVGGLSTPDEKISQDHIKIFMIRTSLLQNQTIDMYVSRAISPSSPVVIKKQEEIFVGDRKAEEFIFDRGNGSLIRGIYIQNGRTLYSFSIAPSDSIHMPIFDQMLQTFEVQ